MDPRNASVYSDTHSALFWVLILSLMIVFVMTLMVSFIALVHRSIEHSADAPKIPALEGLSGGTAASAAARPVAAGTSSPSHAA